MLETSLLGRLYRLLFKPNPIQRLTAARRALPDFLIIGAMRSGTTSLYHLIGMHPGVRPGVTKEVHYFDLNYEKGENWYRAHFPIRSQGERRKWITGESSPYYLFHPLAAGRAEQVLPQARLLVMLRDPVSRAYSHYWNSVRYGYEKRPFEQAIEDEEQDLAKGEKKVLNGEKHAIHQHHSYLSRGRYAGQLEIWFRHFPRENFLILEQRKFYASFQAEAGRVLDFLDLAPVPLEPQQYNKAGYPAMDPGLKVRLQEYFAPHNRQLEDMLGMKFEW